MIFAPWIGAEYVHLAHGTLFTMLHVFILFTLNALNELYTLTRDKIKKNEH